MSQETDVRDPARASKEPDPRSDPEAPAPHRAAETDSSESGTTKESTTGEFQEGSRGRRRSEAATSGGDPRKRLGDEGERRAAGYLRRRGFRILAHNVRCGGVELDLVAQRAGVVVFVEVKTRRGDRYGAPELAVDAAKQARIVRGAAAWLREHPGATRRVRFDVVSCRVRAVRGGRAWAITHIADAFRADGS